MQNRQDDNGKQSEWQPDSVMDLLIAQCSDLEGLLALARRETIAAKSEDFGELFAVFGERATVGARLESYHRQVADLREKLGSGQGAHIDPAMSSMSVRLAMEIQAQDVETTSLLRVTQTRNSEEIARLDFSQRNSLAYLHGARANGLNCDRRG